MLRETGLPGLAVEVRQRGRREVRPLLDVEPRRRPGPAAPRLDALPGHHPRGHGRLALVLDAATVAFVADQLTKKRALGAPGRDPPGRGHSGLLPPRARHESGRCLQGSSAVAPPGWRWIVSRFSLTALGAAGPSRSASCHAGASWRASPSGSCSAARLAICSIAGGWVVVDFLDVFWRSYHAVFNVADSAITVGVSLLAAELAFGGTMSRGGPPPTPEPGEGFRAGAPELRRRARGCRDRSISLLQVRAPDLSRTRLQALIAHRYGFWRPTAMPRRR